MSFNDWKFWLFLLQIVGMVFSVFAFLVIKFNDFKHVQKDILVLKRQLKEIKDIQEAHNGKLAAISARCEERGKVLEILQREGE